MSTSSMPTLPPHTTTTKPEPAHRIKSVISKKLFIFSLLIPALALIVLLLKNFSDESTKALYLVKSSQTRLAATIVEENLKSIINLGTSYVRRPLLEKMVMNGNWDTALALIAEIRETTPGIDRIVLFDTNAIIKADLPRAGVVGENRANKEWFKEFRKDWKPYVSGVYPRSAKPEANVVSVILPIYAGAPISQNLQLLRPASTQRTGILQIQFRLATFNTWTNINLGRQAIIYITDQYGRVVQHPRFEDHSRIIDLSRVGIIGKALAGQSGVEPNYNEVEHVRRLAGYGQIPGFGWVVVVTQPVTEAFRERNTTLEMLTIICALVLILALILTIAVHRIFTMQSQAAQDLNQKNSDLQKSNADLSRALENIKTLRGLLPICAHCKKIRDDQGYWQQIERYLHSHSEAEFSHGICPSCIKTHYPQFNAGNVET